MTTYDLSRKTWGRKREARRRLWRNAALYAAFAAAALLSGVPLPESASTAVSLGLTFVVACLHR